MLHVFLNDKTELKSGLSNVLSFFKIHLQSIEGLYEQVPESFSSEGMVLGNTGGNMHSQFVKEEGCEPKFQEWRRRLCLVVLLTCGLM